MAKEVVVIFAPAAQDDGAEAPMAPEAADNASALEWVLSDYGVSLEPVSDTPPSAPGLEGVGPSAAEAELARYFRTEVGDEAAEGLAERLNALPHVEGAFVKPEVENPIAPFDEAAVLAAPEALEAPVSATAVPNFSPLQGYLGPAPGGVGATVAWTRPGGRGDGVQVIDIEGGWCLTHHDLQPNGGLVGGTPQPGAGWRDHGTAVMGEICAANNGTGVTGIASKAKMAVISHGTLGSAGAIQRAAKLLARGDILLLEMHRPGPRSNYVLRNDQRGYIAVEWWPDDFLAIQLATQRGIIVVEAAGNGAESLDDPVYDTPAPGFPRNWRNPFRGAVDSGAIVVGAGAPPGGSFGPDRSRLDFSNYGSRLDCQGWGRGVVTTGYGDLHQGAGEDEWFTQQFSGTSSASPIVTGVLACLQGIARKLKRPLTPAKARTLLRNTGSPQQASQAAPVSQRIGSRPDLAALIPLI